MDRIYRRTGVALFTRKLSFSSKGILEEVP